jgi:hypothetical protein
MPVLRRLFRGKGSGDYRKLKDSGALFVVKKDSEEKKAVGAESEPNQEMRTWFPSTSLGGKPPAPRGE